jgi:hypothetical protein
MVGSACGAGVGTGDAGDAPTTGAPSTTSAATTGAPSTTSAPTGTTAPSTTVPMTEVAPTTSTPTEAATWPDSVLALLAVDDDPHTEGYSRDDWGGWSDDDGDCLNTRHEVLMAEATASPFLRDDGCMVTGGRWLAAFTGTIVEDPRSLDVDHFVPLANAHRSGGWDWTRDTKRRYANDLTDPRHLIAVTASANRSKGDRGPDEWPGDRYPDFDPSYRCRYADTWADIKLRWSLTVTSTELAALADMLATCDGDPWSDVAPTAIINLGEPIDLGDPIDLGEPMDLGEPENGDDPPNPGDVRNCGDFDDYAAAKAWFDTYADAYGDVARLDGDGDGEPCESLPGGP